MDALWMTAGWVLAAAGIVGCLVPVVPGPLLSYCALLCLLPTSRPPTAAALLAFGLVTAAVAVLDYVVPALGAKKFKCTKLGVAGCFVGTLVGLFFFPVGLLLGPFLGAVAGELISGRSAWESLRGGFGAFLGFFAGTVLKLAACSAMAVFYAMAVLFAR